MKAKTIAKILAGKHASWCRSIDDEAVRKLVEQNTIITGGAIVSLLQNEDVNDYDIYFRDAVTAHKVAEYYVKKLKESPPPAFKDANQTVEIYALTEPAIEAGREEMRINGATKGPQPPRVRIVVKSAGVAGATEQKDYQYFEGIQNPEEQAAATAAYVEAATGGDDDTAEFAVGQVTDSTEPGVAETEAIDGQAAEKADDKDEAKRGKYRVLFVTSNAITLSDKVQIVLRFQGEVGQIHENYDFVHCTSAWTSWDKKLILRPEALECILAKELRYIGSKYPIASMIRTRKFITRGWTINAGQFVKMAWQVSKLDLANPVVLEDQLVGVDSAYFSQVIAELAKQDDPKRVDGTYLMTLIDRIF